MPLAATHTPGHQLENASTEASKRVPFGTWLRQLAMAAMNTIDDLSGKNAAEDSLLELIREEKKNQEKLSAEERRECRERAKKVMKAIHEDAHKV